MKRSLATSRVLTYLWGAALFVLALVGPEMTFAQEAPPADVAAAPAAAAETAEAAVAAPTDAAAAEVPDRPVVAVVELGELGVFARATEGCDARQVTHDMSMPDWRHWLRGICG